MPRTSDVFLRVLDKLGTHLQKSETLLREIDFLYSKGNFPASYEQALNLEKKMEQGVLLSRVLPVYTERPKAASDVEKVIKKTIPIEIGFTPEAWFYLRIPALLPKKETGSVEYLRGYLHPTMRDYFAHHPPIRYTDCVLIYRHVYDRTRPERRKRDHDNIELNAVTDIVAFYVLPDDGPEVCAHYYCSAEGDEESTEVYIVPREDFSQWLVMETSGKKNL